MTQIDLSRLKFQTLLEFYTTELEAENEGFVSFGDTPPGGAMKQVIPALYFVNNNDFEILQNTIRLGMYITLTSTNNYLHIYYVLYDNPYVKYFDLEKCHFISLFKIKRSNILNWEKKEQISFEAAKANKTREIMLGTPTVGGILGSLQRGAYELVGKLENETKTTTGNLFELGFIENGIEKKISINCEGFYTTGFENYLLLNWKQEIPVEPNEIPKAKEGCFIATACYDDYEHPSVIILREFRDNYLLKNVLGKKFVLLYYKFSPPLANMIKEKSLIKKTIRISIINPIVWIVKKSLKQNSI